MANDGKYKFDYDSYYEEEKPYTDEERQQVISELSRGIFLGEINYDSSKRKLKDWFAELCIRYRGEAYEDITCNDLYEIAKEIGFTKMEE